MITNILGYKARVCDKQCKQNFKEDRQAGLNYGLHKFNGVICMHREEFSLVACRCAYCGAEVKGEIPENLKVKFNLAQPPLTAEQAGEAMFS